MNEIEHAFPLPELEQHKLDEVKEEIVHPRSRHLRRWLASNAWLAVTVSMAVGVVAGHVWARRG